MVGMGYRLSDLLPLDPLTLYKLQACALKRKKSQASADLYRAALAASGNTKEINREIANYGR